MPKRKREAEDSDDLVESFKKAKDHLPETEGFFSKQKKKKSKKMFVNTTDERLGLETSSETEESLSQKKKRQQNSADKEVSRAKDIGSSENEDGLSLSHRKKKKKVKKQNSAATKEENSSDELQETGVAKSRTATAQKRASKSKGFVLFVGQIPHHIKQKEIEKHFASVGGVKDVRLLIYEDSQRSRGCAYVEFVDDQHRKAALKLNGSTLGRAKIKVEYPYQGGKRYGGAKKNKSDEKNWKPKNIE